MPLKSFTRRNNHHQSFDFLNAHVYARSIRKIQVHDLPWHTVNGLYTLAFSRAPRCSCTRIHVDSICFPFRWVWLFASTKRLMNWLWQMIKAHKLLRRACWCRFCMSLSRKWQICACNANVLYRITIWLLTKNAQFQFVVKQTYVHALTCKLISGILHSFFSLSTALIFFPMAKKDERLNWSNKKGERKRKTLCNFCTWCKAKMICTLYSVSRNAQETERKGTNIDDCWMATTTTTTAH